MLMHTPLFDPGTIRPRDEADYGWFALLIKAAENVYMSRMGAYWGKVIAMTEDTVTLQKGRRMPRTFLLTPALLSDRIPLKYRPGAMHRLRDVQLGDTVYLDLIPVRDTFVGLNLGITRRPGGGIPPAADGHLPEHLRSHNRYNTFQFVDERVYPALPQLLTRATARLAK
jgi:hypothetical protein